MNSLNKTKISLIGEIHADIRLILNWLPLKLTFHHQRSTFALLSWMQNTNFKINSIDNIQEIIEKRPALYPINRDELKTHSGPAGLTYLDWDNSYNGQLSDQLFVCVLKNTSLNGSCSQNSYNFQYFNLRSIGA